MSKRFSRQKIAFGLLVVLTAAALLLLQLLPDRARNHDDLTPPLRVKVTEAPVLHPAPDHPAPEAVSPNAPQALAALIPPKLAPEMLRPATTTAARIAVVIDDMGLSGPNSRRAVNLPAPVTLSYLPYAPNVQAQVDAARAKGHEVMLHLPMEPLGKDNPGKGALLVGLQSDELHARLETALNAFTGYNGINNHMGSKFTSDAAAMQPVIAAIKQRGVYFLDSKTSSHSIAEAMAREAQIPTAARDVFLDDVIEPAAIRRQLSLAEDIARRKGHAIVIGHPHPATLQVLEEWFANRTDAAPELVTVEAIIGSSQ